MATGHRSCGHCHANRGRAQLEAEGKSRHDLGCDAFIRRVWDWKQQSGSTITRQMRRLGASGNWSYTMDSAHDELRAGQVVTDTFTVVSADGTTKPAAVTSAFT